VNMLVQEFLKTSTSKIYTSPHSTSRNTKSHATPSIMKQL
jgi:hypothetical protein